MRPYTTAKWSPFRTSERMLKLPDEAFTEWERRIRRLWVATRRHHRRSYRPSRCEGMHAVNSGHADALFVQSKKRQNWPCCVFSTDKTILSSSMIYRKETDSPDAIV